ncbi:MAG TPA: hypothetical protein PLL71_06985, partial [Agriterribacter sp.]|nr:hypothetical protein [Agriterribacter sp.]
MNSIQVSFMAMLLICSHGVWAQEDSTRATSLNEIVITATRFPKKVSETGKVVTVINSQDIARSDGKDMAQLLSDQAGILVNGAYSNPGKD